MIQRLWWIVWCALMVWLVGCQPTSKAAPVGTLAHVPEARNHYMVRPGDTLYSIAWAYQLDPQALADFNQLHSPDAVHPNQVLTLPGAQEVKRDIAKKQGVVQKKVRRLHRTHKQVASHRMVWQRPVAQGRMQVAPKPYHGLLFGHTSDLRVRAAADGRVVYSGKGIRGYGHLLLLDHGAGILSAYGFNEVVDVKVGDHVRRGQVIAKMGIGPTPGRWLYFEVRKQGRPLSTQLLSSMMRK